MTNTSQRYALLGRIVTMDAQFSVIEHGAIYIQDSRIAAVQAANAPPPQGFEAVQPVDTGGSIYPGLIELHNHLSYNILPIWTVPKRFQDRWEWRSSDDRVRLISGPMKAIAGKKVNNQQVYVPTLVRYVECKCLMSGTTTSQGMSLFAAPGIAGTYRGLVRNVEQSTTGIAGATLPAAESHVDMGDPATIAQNIRQASCVLLHIAEGIGQKARDEFLSLRQPDGTWAVTKALAAIHCVGLQPEDLAVLGQNGGAMIWSPMSNLMLYSQTADVAAAKAAHVPIALGADWSPTGSKNLLGEMKVAWLHSQQAGDLFAPRDLVAMATTTPAAILKWQDQLGSLESGKLADLLVVQSSPNAATNADPYVRLLHASESDIALVVIDGVPRFGAIDVLRKAGKAWSSDVVFEQAIEPWPIGNKQFGLYLKQADAHPAVAMYSLKQAVDLLREALDKLPDPPGFTPPALDLEVDVPELTLDLDNNEEPDSLEVSAPILPGPMLLDELTAAEALDTYVGRITGQANLPGYVKDGLRALYEEKTVPQIQSYDRYFPTDEPLREHLEKLSTCRDARCPVPNEHPFYPVAEQPPFFYGKRPCMPVVPTRLKMGGVMVLGIYPNCKRATVTPANGAAEHSVPVQDAEEPFQYARYFDGYGVRDLRAGTILQKAYWAQLELDREKDMYITNITKCFLFEDVEVAAYKRLGWTTPPVKATRTRYFEAAAVCVQLWLAKEIEMCKPKLVISMGGEGCRVIHGRMNAADANENKPFTRLRGKLLRANVNEGPDDARTPLFKGLNVLHLYHPSGLSSGNINTHLNDMKNGRQALVDIGLAQAALLQHAVTPAEIDEIKGLIRAHN